MIRRSRQTAAGEGTYCRLTTGRLTTGLGPALTFRHGVATVVA